MSLSSCVSHLYSFLECNLLNGAYPVGNLNPFNLRMASWEIKADVSNGAPMPIKINLDEGATLNLG